MRLRGLRGAIERIFIGGDRPAEVARGEAIGAKLELFLWVMSDHAESLAAAQKKQQHGGHADQGSRVREEKLNETTHGDVLHRMTIFRRARASAPRAEFVNRPRAVAWSALGVLVALLIASERLHADLSESVRLAPAPPASESDEIPFRLSLALRGERMPNASLQSRSRRLHLPEFVEPEAPATAAVTVGATVSREDWDWAGLRRQVVRGLAGTRRIRFDREGVRVESDRFNEPGRMPGVVQDAAIAAGVRARLAVEPALRLIVSDVQCREGCVRIRGRF